MSRIGSQPVPVPSGVEIRLDQGTRTIEVKGPKGNLSYQWRPEIAVAHDEDGKQLICSVAAENDESRESRAFWGTVRSRINGMVVGASQGFTKKLNIVGVGWNAQAQGQNIVLNIGFCHPVTIEAPAGVTFDVEKNTAVTVTGADKQGVGQFAAEIRSKRPPEPYNGKGIMYHDEVIIRKQGKAFGA